MTSNIKSTSMHLYHLTIQKESNVTCKCFGSFSKPKQQEIVMCRGSKIDLARVDDSGNIEIFSTVDTFSCGTLKNFSFLFLIFKFLCMRMLRCSRVCVRVCVCVCVCVLILRRRYCDDVDIDIEIVVT